jgi:hypothetical protein
MPMIETFAKQKQDAVIGEGRSLTNFRFLYAMGEPLKERKKT